MKRKSQKQKKRTNRRKTYKKLRGDKIGGFRNFIEDNDFKYTLNEKRKVWVKNMYPNLNILLNTIQNVHWNEYEYNGDAVISFNVNDKNEEPKDPLNIEQVVPVSSEKETLDYILFGGICYEILSDVYQNVKLSTFIDPTGDIDVQTRIPSIEKNTEILKITEEINTNKEKYGLLSDDSIYPKIKLITIDKKINPYYKHLLDWIFDNLKQELDKLDINKLFPNAVDFDILDEDYDEIPEAHRTSDLGFRHEKIGNANFVGFITDIASDESIEKIDQPETMVKVQLIFKIESEGFVIVDHVLEIIFTTRTGLIQGIDSYSKYIKSSIEIEIPGTNNVFQIENLGNLTQGNISAYKLRVLSVENNDMDNAHKAFNHIGRIFYLFDIIKHNKKDKLINSNRNIQRVLSSFGDIASLFHSLIKEEISKRSSEITVTDRIEKNKILTQIHREVNDYFAKVSGFKIYKNIEDGKINWHNVRVVDFIMAYIDVFVLYNNANSVGIFRKEINVPSDINPDEPYINDQYQELMNIIQSSH